MLKGMCLSVKVLWMGIKGESVTLAASDEVAKEGTAGCPLPLTGNICSSDSCVESTKALWP